nr:hypothetical protein [Shigella dysenteriae]
MKTVVFAYHDMGCLGIEALLSDGYEISAIFTHTDNPGEKAFYGSVARLAAERGIPVYAPDNVNHELNPKTWTVSVNRLFDTQSGILPG